MRRLALALRTVAIILSVFVSCADFSLVKAFMGVFGYVRVIYDGNGNSSGEPPVDVKHCDSADQAIILANTGFLEKNGQFLCCWNDKPDGSGKEYVPGDVITLGRTKLPSTLNMPPRTQSPTMQTTHSLA